MSAYVAGVSYLRRVFVSLGHVGFSGSSSAADRSWPSCLSLSNMGSSVTLSSFPAGILIPPLIITVAIEAGASMLILTAPVEGPAPARPPHVF